MDPIIVEKLRNLAKDAGDDVQRSLVDLKHTLERVKGLSHWLKHHLTILEWCSKLLTEIGEPRDPVSIIAAARAEIEEGT